MALITSKAVKPNENAVYYFKKSIFINELKKSTVNIFAEARYKLYINGRLAAIGPLRQTSEIKYYDTVDITGYLKPGENLFEVSVLQLENNLFSAKRKYLESVIRSGNMALCLWGNAGDAKVSTDESYLCAKEENLSFFFEPEYEFYNAVGLCEKAGADYKKGLSFKNAVLGQDVYSLSTEESFSLEIPLPLKKRPIPMMYFKETAFKSENGGIYDAGGLTCGYVRLKASGKGQVKITYAESMVFLEDGKIVKRKRDASDGVIIGHFDLLEVDGDLNFEPFWMRTFRFIKAETSGDVKIEGFDYLETGYPIEIADGYDFGSDIDNKLFKISANTLKRCMHETYVDCPYYEQLQYAMDTHLQILYTYQLTGDRALAEKAIDDFAQSYRAGFLTQSRYPTGKSQYIPGFSLFFIFMLYEHCRRFKDKTFTRKYIHIADGILDWFLNRLDGYMVKRSNVWDFIDWADGYIEGQTTEWEPGAAYSLMLSEALGNTCSMHEFLGSRTDSYKETADKIKADVKARCFDEKSGLYGNTPTKKEFSQHTQIWAVLSGLEDGEGAKNILKKSMHLKCKASSAYMFYLFRALEKADEYDMTDGIINSLRELVTLGCTTTPEWLGEDVRSECHAWSAVVLYEFTAKVLGVTYHDNTIYIKPYVNKRRFAKGKVATPAGMVSLEWKIKDDEFTIEITLPAGKTAQLTLPDGSEITAESGIYVAAKAI